jgi:hypothetical protein
MEVFGGVLVLGRIAAADVTAAQTQPEMHPDIAELDAVFADAGLSGGDFHLVQVAAFG